MCFRAEWEASAHAPHETNECGPQGWGEPPGATFSGGPTTAPSVCGTVCSSFQQAAWLRDGVCCSSVPKHHRSRRRMGQNTNDGRVRCAWEGHDMAGKARTSERGRLSARVSSRSLPHSIAGGLRWHGAVTFRACCARSPRPRHENWRGGHPVACRATGRAHVRYAAGPLARACCSGQRRARGDGLRLRAIKALYFAPRRRDA